MNLRDAEFMQYRRPVGGGPVIENMAEMRIAMFAPDLGARHEKVMVFLLHDISRLKRLGEARPSGPGFIFVLGAEQGFPGNDVDVNSFPLVIPVFILEGGSVPSF